MISVSITQFKNPLSTEIGVIRLTGFYAPGITVGEVKRQLDVDLPLVLVDGQIVEDSIQLNKNCSLVLATEAHGGGFFKQVLVAAAIGAITGGIGFAFGVGSATSLSSALISGAVTGAITAGVGIVVGKLIGGGGISPSQSVDREERPSYGLSGVNNQIRGLGPVNWSFGRTLVSPPLDARQWTQYVDDGVNQVTETYQEKVTEQVCSVQANEVAPDSWVLKSCPAWTSFSDNFEWIQQSTRTIWRNQQTVITAATTDGQDVNSNTLKAMLYDTATGLFQLEGETVWGTLDQVHPTVTYVATKTRTGFLNTEELTASFNFGLGDLVLEDERFNHTQIGNFHSIHRTRSVAFSDRSKLGIDTPHPNPPDSILAPWPDDCISIPGGELRKNAGVAGSNQEWVVREFFGNCDVIGVDLSGNLYSQDNSGNLVNLTVQFQIQWAIESGAWQAASVGAAGVVSITNNSTFPVRESYDWLTNSTAEHFRVRVRRVTSDSTKPTEQSQISFIKARFHVKTGTTKVSPLDLGVAQTRVGFTVKATGQLNGSIQDYSAVVSGKAWVYTGGSVWNGNYPGGAGWSWQVTSNPAWCYAYMLQGIHICNTDPDGWCVGPETATGQRLSGAGVEASLIDWQALVEWASFCDANGLTFDHTFQGGNTTLNALQTVARCGRASPIYAWGKWSIVVERSDAVAVRTYGPNNILAETMSMSYEHPTVDEIVVRFTNSQKDDWHQDEVSIMVPGRTIPTERLETEITGCVYQEMARKEARLLAARQHWQTRTISFDALNDGLLRGDIINVVDSMLGAGQTARVYAVNGPVLTLSHEVEIGTGTTLQVTIQSPTGTIQSFTAPMPTQTGVMELTLSGSPVIDPDSFDGVIEDYVVHLTPVGQIGFKRFRVVAVRPQKGFQLIGVTATEEPALMWDWVNGGTNTQTEIIDRTVARCYNPSITKDLCSDTYQLKWTNEGCLWVDVMVNGSVTRVNGDSVSVSGVTLGQQIAIVLTPVFETSNGYKIEVLTETVTVQ